MRPNRTLPAKCVLRTDFSTKSSVTNTVDQSSAVQPWASSRGREHPEAEAPDRTAYQREYMRKKRAENPDYRPIIEPIRDLPDWRKPPLK